MNGPDVCACVRLSYMIVDVKPSQEDGPLLAAHAVPPGRWLISGVCR